MRLTDNKVRYTSIALNYLANSLSCEDAIVTLYLDFDRLMCV